MPTINLTLSTKFSCLLRRCRHINAAIKHGQQTHTQILIHGLHIYPTLQTDLILFYARSSHFKYAHCVFDEMSRKTMHACNILVSSYVQSNLHNKSLRVFKDLLNASCKPDHYTLPSLFKACAALRHVLYGSSLHCWIFKIGLHKHVVVITSVLDMYVKCSYMDDALKVFDEIHVKDVFVWNLMISSFAKEGLLSETMKFCKMLQFQGGEIDAFTISSLLSVCGKNGELRKGKEVHGRVIRLLLFTYDVVVNNSLIDMYGKCGCIADSFKVFTIMSDRKNVITWSTMISCYGVHGQAQQAFSLYNEMLEQGFRPNSITFTSLLSSCNHSGLVHYGRELFYSMIQDYGLTPSVEHYACMVDLLGRAGHINEAIRLIRGMRIEPKASIWGALLSACMYNSNVEIAEIVAYKLFELELENCSNYIALCNVYEMNGMLEKVAKIRARMRQLGMVKTPGCSWIDINWKTKTFYQGDIHFPSSKMVCEVLSGLCRQSKSDEEINQSMNDGTKQNPLLSWEKGCLHMKLDQRRMENCLCCESHL